MRLRDFVRLLVFAVVISAAFFMAGRSSAGVHIAPSSRGLPHSVQTANRAWRWFWTPATQCETRHEGGWRSDTGTYRGKFQMDYGFQTSTPYGRKLTARFGLASRWPRIAQVVQAYSVWLIRGWDPWPPYRRFCGGLWPRAPYAWRASL